MPSPYDPIKQNILYPLDNPDYAVRSAMSDVGINPYTANPYAQAVGRLGRSTANSYLAMMASDNDFRDTGPYAIGNQGAGGRGSAVAFSDYLRNTLTGSGQQVGPQYPGRTEGIAGERGPAFNALLTTRAFAAPTYGGTPTTPGLPGAITKIRDYRNGLAAGTVTANTLNPWVATLSDRLGANGGMGTVDFLSDLYAPFMAPSMANAYRRALTGAGEQAIRQLTAEPLTTQNDIWTYLLGY